MTNGYFGNVVQGAFVDSKQGTDLKIRSRSAGDAYNDAIVIDNTNGTSTLLKVNLDRTITAAGTTGAQTINKMAGRVNFANLASSLVVTNSLCTTSSIVVATTGTSGSTGVLSVVPAAGSFTITLTGGAVGETAVNWVLFN